LSRIPTPRPDVDEELLNTLPHLEPPSNKQTIIQHLTCRFDQPLDHPVGVMQTLTPTISLNERRELLYDLSKKFD
jgi:hypothetical protein